MASTRPFAAFPWAASLVVLVLLASSCSGLPGVPPPNPPANPPSSSAPTEPPPLPPATPSDPTSADPTSTGSPSGTPSASPSPAGPPAGTKTATIEGQRVTLNVFPIRRSGTLSVLDFTLGLPPAEPGQESETVLLSTTFDDGNSSTGDRTPYSVDGVKLVDSRNRKAYLVASETGGRCLCSTGVNTLSFKPGETYDFYATFAAPPAAVTELEVTVPRFGAIPNVPVQ